MWLPCSGPKVSVMGMETPVPCLDGTWALVVVRVLPSLLVSMMDSAVAYQITLLVWGVARGEGGWCCGMACYENCGKLLLAQCHDLILKCWVMVTLGTEHVNCGLSKLPSFYPCWRWPLCCMHCLALVAQI